MCISFEKTVGNRDGIRIKKQTHLDQGITCVVLAKTFAAKIIFLIDLEVVICHIIENHMGPTPVINFDLLMQMKEKSLTKLRKIIQGTVNVVPITVKRSGQVFFLKETCSFRPRSEHTCVHQQLHNIVKRVIYGFATLAVDKKPIKLQFVID